MMPQRLRRLQTPVTWCGVDRWGRAWNRPWQGWGFRSSGPDFHRYLASNEFVLLTRIELKLVRCCQLTLTRIQIDFAENASASVS